jgi:transcriptional regulator with XRE-family HTH domain
MEYEEFRRHLGKAGLNINKFAALVDVTPSSISNYAKKTTVPRHYAVLAILLGDAADNNVDFRALLARFGVFGESTDSKVAQLQDYRAGPLRRPK